MAKGSAQSDRWAGERSKGTAMAAYQHSFPVADVNKVSESRTESTHAVNTTTHGARPQGPQNASSVGSL